MSQNGRCSPVPWATAMPRPSASWSAAAAGSRTTSMPSAAANRPDPTLISRRGPGPADDSGPRRRARGRRSAARARCRTRRRRGRRASRTASSSATSLASVASVQQRSEPRPASALVTSGRASSRLRWRSSSTRRRLAVSSWCTSRSQRCPLQRPDLPQHPCPCPCPCLCLWGRGSMSSRSIVVVVVPRSRGPKRASVVGGLSAPRHRSAPPPPPRLSRAAAFAPQRFVPAGSCHTLVRSWWGG